MLLLVWREVLRAAAVGGEGWWCSRWAISVAVTVTLCGMCERV